MFEKYLQDIGLNDKEASVYLALLSYENVSVLDLAKKTNIKRPTVYTALESLAKKGLVSEVTVGKKTHYFAELPEKLETLVDKKILHLTESKRTLKEMVPRLKSLVRDHGERPVVKYFDGKDGIFSSNDEITRSLTNNSEPMYVVYPKDLVEETFTKEELQKFREKRTSKNIKSLSIYTSKESTQASDNLSERLKVDGQKYPITSDITVYKDIVLISTLGKRTSAILIKNIDVAETMRSLLKIILDSRKS